jgi:hypothetical protein
MPRRAFARLSRVTSLVTELLLNVSHALFEPCELGDGHHVEKNGSQRGQRHRLGVGVLGEVGDPISRPGDVSGHPADGAIEGATARGLHRGADIGLPGPPEGRPPGDIVFLCPTPGPTRNACPITFPITLSTTLAILVPVFVPCVGYREVISGQKNHRRSALSRT